MRKVEITLSSTIRIPEGALPPDGVRFFKEKLTFRNPLFYRNERLGRPNPPGLKPTLLAGWIDEGSGDLLIARGYLSELIRLLHANRYEPEIVDETRKLEKAGFLSGADRRGISSPEQTESLEELSKQRFGILTGPTGSGKKAIACRLVAKRKAPALVIVSTKADLYAWREAAASHLGLKKDQIGLIGDGRREIGRPFTVAITLSLWKVMDQVEPLTGFVIVDQCHVASLSVLFRISRFNCPYLLGLATRAQRQDGLTELMHAHLGQTVFELAAPEDQNRAEPILDIKDTSFQFEYREDWHGLVTALCQDEKRNRNIAGDVLQATAGNGRKAVVISERVGHLHDLARIIGTAHGECEILTGENSDSFRAKIARRFALGKLKILMAPFKSVPSIPAKGATDLFICSPVKYQDYLAQILGAVLNGKVGHERRRPVIHDYKDKTEVLRRSLDMRVKCYQSLGAVSR